jgi:hypothetical protein
MKTIKRVRPNYTAAAAAQQRKTSPKKVVRVVFFATGTGRKLFHVDFPWVLFAAIKRVAKKLGIGLDEFFEIAIWDKIKCQKSEAAGAANGGAQ